MRTPRFDAARGDAPSDPDAYPTSARPDSDAYPAGSPQPSRAAGPRDPRRPNPPAVSRQPWWIGEGSEPCPFCLQGYVLELEMRCVACDRPGCMHCMVRVKRAHVVEVFCPECTEET